MACLTVSDAKRGISFSLPSGFPRNSPFFHILPRNSPDMEVGRVAGLNSFFCFILLFMIVLFG